MICPFDGHDVGSSLTKKQIIIFTQNFIIGIIISIRIEGPTATTGYVNFIDKIAFLWFLY